MRLSRRALIGGLYAGALGSVAGCASPDTQSAIGDGDGAAIPDTLIDVRDFGARGDGSTDDGEAIGAALKRATAVSTPYSGAVLFFPPGRYVDSHSHEPPSDQRIAVIGAGPGVSVVVRDATAQASWWNARAAFSSISGITINAQRSPGSGNLVSLNCSYGQVRNVHFEDAPVSALVIGDEQTAIGHVLENLQFRRSGQHHVVVSGANDSTDGRWINIEAGISGHSGVRIESGAQSIANIHIWGSGVADDSDNSGICVLSSDNTLGSGWQSEKNLGPGLVVDGSGNVISSGRSWGNVGLGIDVRGGNGNIVSSNIFRDNSIGASSRSRDVFVAALNGGAQGVFSGNVFSESTEVLGPTIYSDQPKFPYPGRVNGSNYGSRRLRISAGGSVDELTSQNFGLSREDS